MNTETFKAPAENVTFNIMVKSDTVITVSKIDTQGEEVLIDYVQNGRIRGKEFDVTEFRLTGPKGSKFKSKVKLATLNHHEDQNHDNPPPPPDANNFLKRIREKVRQEMGVTRESFMVFDGEKSPYEYDEDEEVMFEEEHQDMMQAKQELEKSSKENSDGDKPSPKPEAAQAAEENSEPQTKGEQKTSENS